MSGRERDPDSRRSGLVKVSAGTTGRRKRNSSGRGLTRRQGEGTFVALLRESLGETLLLEQTEPSVHRTAKGLLPLEALQPLEGVHRLSGVKHSGQHGGIHSAAHRWIVIPSDGAPATGAGGVWIMPLAG